LERLAERTQGKFKGGGPASTFTDFVFCLLELSPQVQIWEHYLAMKDTLKKKSRPTVLVAEDHEDSRKSIRMLLEMCGYHVLEAAFEITCREHPDLVLLDVRLPDLDGLVVTRRLRSRESFGKLPIVIVSGQARAEDREKAMAAGCSAYLTKPIDFDQLHHLMRRLVPSAEPTV
jgi:two-component system cell cycle response regulator DivK